MKHQVCGECMKNYMVERIEGSHFFALTGAAVGSVAGLITGLVLLAPVGLFAGLLLDTAKCEDCGSTDNVYKVLIQIDRQGRKTYTQMPFTLYDDKEPFDEPFSNKPPEEYLYDEIEGRFTLIDNTNDITDTFPFDTLISDSQTDCDFSYDFGDRSFEMDSAGEDGFGDSGSDFGSGDGGDFGSASGGGEGSGD